VGIISVGGKLKELTDARDWAAVFIVEKDGVETSRLFPTSDSEIASTQTWKVNCSGGCTWSGTNYYFYDFNQTEFAQAVTDGGQVKIVVQKYGEIQSFPFPDSLE
jgi:hypothetical protein